MGWLLAMTLPGLVLLLTLLAAVERFGLWAQERSWLPWMKKRPGMSISSAGFDELTATLQGAKRIELDYRQSSLMLRDDEADGAPPRTTVDLDEGVVRIVPPGPGAVKRD